MWHYKTHKGTVSIVPKNGRYHVFYNGDSLGSYASPEQAADDASSGSTFSPRNGVNLGDLGIPSDLPDWNRGNPE